MDGCFSLVGANVPRELLAPEDHCVQYVVPEGEEVMVSPGDVVGFYVDRFKLERRGDRLQDAEGGGIQLDSEWSLSDHPLTTSPGVAVGDGTQLCGPEQLAPATDGGAPVLSASIGEATHVR